MAKNLASKLRTGAMVGLAALAVAAPMKAKAGLITRPINVYTTISPTDVDQDPNREGIQLRYDWAVENNSGYDWTSDALLEYAIETDLLNERQMYGFTNSGNVWSSSTDSANDTYSWLANLSGSFPIRAGDIKTFSAFIDQNLVIGNEEVQSYGMSNNGQTQFANATVPIAIPEPMAMGLFALGGAAALVGRRMKNDSRRY